MSTNGCQGASKKRSRERIEFPDHLPAITQVDPLADQKSRIKKGPANQGVKGVNTAEGQGNRSVKTAVPCCRPTAKPTAKPAATTAATSAAKAAANAVGKTPANPAAALVNVSNTAANAVGTQRSIAYAAKAAAAKRAARTGVFAVSVWHFDQEEANKHRISDSNSQAPVRTDAAPIRCNAAKRSVQDSSCQHLIQIQQASTPDEVLFHIPACTIRMRLPAVELELRPPSTNLEMIAPENTPAQEPNQAPQATLPPERATIKREPTHAEQPAKGQAVQEADVVFVKEDPDVEVVEADSDPDLVIISENLSHPANSDVSPVPASGPRTQVACAVEASSESLPPDPLQALLATRTPTCLPVADSSVLQWLSSNGVSLERLCLAGDLREGEESDEDEAGFPSRKQGQVIFGSMQALEAMLAAPAAHGNLGDAVFLKMAAGRPPAGVLAVLPRPLFRPALRALGAISNDPAHAAEILVDDATWRADVDYAECKFVRHLSWLKGQPNICRLSVQFPRHLRPSGVVVNSLASALRRLKGLTDVVLALDVPTHDDAAMIVAAAFSPPALLTLALCVSAATGSPQPYRVSVEGRAYRPPLQALHLGPDVALADVRALTCLRKFELPSLNCAEHQLPLLPDVLESVRLLCTLHPQTVRGSLEAIASCSHIMELQLPFSVAMRGQLAPTVRRLPRLVSLTLTPVVGPRAGADTDSLCDALLGLGHAAPQLQHLHCSDLPPGHHVDKRVGDELSQLTSLQDLRLTGCGLGRRTPTPSGVHHTGGQRSNALGIQCLTGALSLLTKLTRLDLGENMFTKKEGKAILRAVEGLQRFELKAPFFRL